MSDPVDLEVAPLANLAVSLYFEGKASATALPSGGSTTTSWYFLNGVEVGSRSPRDAIVALGDSITDGYASTVDANHRWPNYLAARLQEKHGTSDIAVVDQGIGGNRVLHDLIGPNALARFDRDVLAQSGARWVIVLEGINDSGDRLHPNDAGYEAMAGAIDLSLFGRGH